MGKSRPPFKVSDYLQISCHGKYCVEIHVEGNKGYKGNIIIHKGELWYAEDNVGKGDEAFRRAVLEKNSIVDCSTFTGDIPWKNIETEWEELLFKIYTRKDRDIYLAKKEALNPEVDEISLKKAFSEATEYLLAKDYKKAHEILLELKKADPDNKKILVKLEKLEKLGYEK